MKTTMLMSRTMIFLAAVAFGAQLAIAAPASSESGQLTHKQVLKIALAEAKDSRDPHPKRIEMATGTFERAEQVLEPTATPGSLGHGKEVVDLVVMSGYFHINGHPPLGRHIGPGTVFCIVLDAHTGVVQARSLSETAPALSHLGPVTRLR